MTYTPINWQTGDTITAEKLNKMDNGWDVASTQLFSETVTTTSSEYGNMAALAYNGTFNEPSLIVTFDGTDYTCPAVIMTGYYYYGGMGPNGPDFTDYPFVVGHMGAGNYAFTETAGTYTIAAAVETIEASDGFLSAISLANKVLIATERVTTWQEIHDALADGKDVRINSASGSSVYSEPVYSATFDGTNYEVVSFFVNGGDASARYYIAASASSAIYGN